MYENRGVMQATFPLTVVVADGHRSIISASFISVRDKRGNSTSTLRYGYDKYGKVVSPETQY